MRLLTFFLLLTISIPALAQNKLRADKSKSFITYAMNHALHAWTGTTRDVNCLVETDAQGKLTKVAVVAKVSSFDSENSNRDSHMLEVVDALNHPNLSFVSTSITAVQNGYKVSGNMTFHGVSRPQEIIVKEEGAGDRKKFTGNFIFLLEDYKIERPSFMLVKTDNEVKVNLEIWL